LFVCFSLKIQLCHHRKKINKNTFKGTLHPFALSFVSLETQSGDGRNKDLSVLLPAYYDVKIVILRHYKQEVTFH